MIVAKKGDEKIRDKYFDVDVNTWQERYYDRHGNPIDRDCWDVRFEDPEYRRVKKDKIDNYIISTVWIGFDLNFDRSRKPLIFETMVFKYKLGEWGDEIEMRRYSTLQEAKKGHDRMCEVYLALGASICKA